MAESEEIRTHGIIENAKNTNKRGKTSFRTRRPSKSVIARLESNGLIVSDIEGNPNKVTISFEPTLSMFKEVQDTP